MKVWRFLVLLLVCIAPLVSIASKHFAQPQQKTYELYLTVGEGEGDNEGPVAGADVTISGPVGAGGVAQLLTTTKKSDDEGILKFTLNRPGKYNISATHFRHGDYEGTVTIADSSEPTYEYIKLKPSKARITVTTKDAETGKAISGVTVRTTRNDKMVGDHMTTDDAGEAVVIISQETANRNKAIFKITVSHPDYETKTGFVEVDETKARNHIAPFALKRARGLKEVVIETLEEGTKAKVAYAKVTLDGGGNLLYSASTEADGKATFRVQPNAMYALTIKTEHYEEVKSRVDLLSAGAPGSTTKTFLLQRKEGDREIRRAAIITVKAKLEDGQTVPVKGIEVMGPGLHDAVTDAQGRIVFFHKVVPGETITFTAQKVGFKPGATTVLVRDKGVMVDLDQLSRDTAKGLTTYEAFRKQGASAYDTGQITLELDVEQIYKASGKIKVKQDPVALGDDGEATVSVTYNSGDTDDLDVREVITVTGPGGSTVYNDIDTPSLSLKETRDRTFAFPCRKPGSYRIKASYDYKGNVLWTGEATFMVTDIKITGDVVPRKKVVKLDERIDVMVNVLYEEGGKDKLVVKETVELFDPQGKVVQNNFSQRNLTKQSYSERNMAITCQASGTYRLKSTITSLEGKELWVGEDTFEVSKQGTAVTAKPGQGYYKLVKTVVGEAPGADRGPYGTHSGSISESSFTYSYETTTNYDNHASLSLTWSKPPSIIKANETIELTVSGSGSVTGKDRSGHGVSGSWAADGAEMIEGKSVFVGLASDGKEYTSGSSSFKFKVGSGASLKIYNRHMGASWGSSPNWTPGLYIYEWVANAAPPANGGSGKTSLTDSGTTEKEKPAPNYAGTYVHKRVKVDVGEDYYYYDLILKVEKSSKPGVYTVTGTFENESLPERLCTLSGSLYVSNKKLSGTGKITTAGYKDWTVWLDGAMDASGVLKGEIQMQKNDKSKVEMGSFAANKK